MGQALVIGFDGFGGMVGGDGSLLYWVLETFRIQRKRGSNYAKLVLGMGDFLVVFSGTFRYFFGEFSDTFPQSISST